MRICFLTQYYPPEVGAPQTRLSDLSKRFHDKGHDVTVLTAMPNYPRGAIYGGYGGFFQKETINGINILRGFIYPTISTGLFKRLLNYFSFVLSSIIIGSFKLPRQDFIVTESPPLFLGISGFLLSKLKFARFVFNVADLWPQSAVELGIITEGLSLKVAQQLERLCYTEAYLVSGQSREIVGNIKSRFPDVATYHLSNGTDANEFAPGNRSDKKRKLLFGNAKIVGVYAGLHGIAQGLSQVVYASEFLQDIDGLCIVLVGDGPEKEYLQTLSNKLKTKTIIFRDPVSKNEMPSLLASADFAIVPLKHRLLGAVPSKTYEAMASGLPVLMVADGEPAEIVKSSECGIVVEPGNIVGISTAIRTMAKDSDLRMMYANNGIEAARKFYDRNIIASDFVEFLEEKL